MGPSLLPRIRGKDIALISPAKTKHFQQYTFHKIWVFTRVFTAVICHVGFQTAEKTWERGFTSNHMTLAGHLKTWQLLAKVIAQLLFS